MYRLFFCLLLSGLLQGSGMIVFASGTLSEQAIADVSRLEASSREQQAQLSIAAGLLAEYEIAAKKLLASLEMRSVSAGRLNSQAKQLLSLSESVIDSTRFRLPQCEVYLIRAMALKGMLETISHAALEKDYHHDGVLPEAPGECYHTKDLFVHPATALVLTRDDPALSQATRTAINAEISEVLAHTDLLRQLLIY